MDESRALYEQGREAFADGDFERAIQLLEESLGPPNLEGHPVTLQYIALAHLALDRPQPALDATERVQESGREHSGIVIAKMLALHALGFQERAQEYWSSLSAKPNSPKLVAVLKWIGCDNVN